MRAAALMGATGTGKSALAMQLAAANGSMIVCCDSMQVYRGLDIGTAKPTPDERQAVRHAMVDCCELPEQYSAARWAADAAVEIRAENEAGRVPLIVGGTGLYLKALLEGFSDIPAEDTSVREALVSLQQQHGTPYMHALLAEVDPSLAERLPANDTQRILRALAVQRTTGTPLSTWQQGSREQPIDCPVFVLELPRDTLRERLAIRFEAMLAAGWLDEVRWLSSLGLAETHPAMRAVGYRQLLDHLLGRLTLEAAVRDGITATRRYAKRQVTWFAHQTPTAVHGTASELESGIMEALRR